MNFAQCVDPQWVRERMPSRSPMLAPMIGFALRVITRRDGLETRRPVGASVPVPEDFDRAPVLRRPRPPAPATMRAAPPPAVVAPRRSRSEARRRSETNPWPRGKMGLRLLVLRALAGSPAPGVTMRDLAAHVGGWSGAQVSMALRNLRLCAWISRSGAPKHYRYAITPAGRAALAWEG